MWTWLAIGGLALAAFWLAEVTFMWFTLRAERRGSPAPSFDESELQNRGLPGS
jgi:hypothetical protein